MHTPGSLIPASYDFTIFQGVTFAREFRVKDGAGNPLDLTGFTVTAALYTIDKSAKQADFVVSWVDQASGHFRLTLAHEVTATIDAGGQWDALLTNPDGSRDVLFRGFVALEI